MKITPESAALTARIIELRDQGLTWAKIGVKVGLSRQSVRWRVTHSGGVPDVAALKAENSRLRVRLERIRKILDDVDNGA